MNPGPPPDPSIESIARHYDSLDRFYRDIWGEHVHHGLWISGRESSSEAVLQMSRKVLESLELFPGARLADIGCGYGGTSRLAAEGYGAHVVGYTVSSSQKAFADAARVARGSVEIRLQDWSTEVFRDAEFDAALALESLEHFADKAGFMRTMRRAVKKGRPLVLATWLRADKVSAWSQRHLLDALCREGRQPALVTADFLCGTIRQAGFMEVSFEDLTHQVAKTWGLIIARAAVRLVTRRQYRHFLFHSKAEDRIFAVTAARIWMAFKTGAFRYGFIRCR